VLASLPAQRKSWLLLKVLVWGLAGVSLYALLGFVVLPPVVKSVLTKQVSEKLHRETAIRQIHINPFLLTVEVGGFSLKDRGGSAPFLSFDVLRVDFQAMSLVKGGPVLKDIRLKGPHLSLVRNEDQTYNFSDLLEEFGSTSAPEEKPPKPFRFSLNNIQLTEGHIDFDDRPKQARHTVKDVTLAIPFISNMPSDVDVYVKPTFEADVNGTPVALHGKTKPFSNSRETIVELDVTDFEVPKYLEYVPVDMRFKIVSGALDTKITLSFVQFEDKGSTLMVAGTLLLTHLAATDMNAAPLMSLPGLAVELASFDVFSKKLILDTVVLQSPELAIKRDKNGAINLASLIPKDKVEKQEDQKANKTPAGEELSIKAGEIRLINGKVTFEDDAMATPFRTVLEKINITARHFSNAANEATSIEASMNTDAGELLTHSGSATLQPLTAAGNLQLSHVVLKRYAAYYGKNFLFYLEDGVLNLASDYRYTGEGGQTQVSGLTATLGRLRLRKLDEKEDFLRIPLLAIKNTDIDVSARTVTIGEVSSQKGTLAIKRGNDGGISLAKLTAPLPATANIPAVAPPENEATPTAWLVTLKKLALDRYAVTVEDLAVSEPATFVADPVTLTGENLSSAKGSRGKASVRLTLNKSGTLSATGPLGMDPTYADLKVSLKGVSLAALQPYFTDKINVAVTNGAVGASGHLKIVANRDNAMGVTFTGDATVSDLATIDKAASEDFLKWNSLAVNGIKAGNKPLRVEIDKIALTDFYSRLIVNADGTLNVQGIMVRGSKESQSPEMPQADSAKPQSAEDPPHSAEDSQSADEPTSVTINTVTMQGGNISFSDHFIKPNYSARLAEVGGRISGLSSEETRHADVDLRGKLEGGSPLQIVGTINPLGRDLFVDIRVDFKDIELSPMTPYAAKYAGYGIEKGKLSLSLKYLIEKRMLNAQNKIVLDQFTFGDKVDSPTATKLPVRFAVSLLKDRNGLIDLDLPVTGSLDDPQFSVWGVIGRILSNLLTKAATAPFALLGSLISGAPDLSHIEFAYGKQDLDSAAQDALKALSKILFERPGLKLEIVGHVDAEKDQEALRQQQFDRKLKVQKLKELTKSATGATLDDVKVDPNEYTRYLTLAYKKETFPKPRNVLGMNKDLEVPEMEKLILAHIIITEDDLRKLAEERAGAVKDDLVRRNIEPSRIFLLAASLKPSQDKSEKLKDSRVDFVIR
jgi:hypothetical protein